MRRRIAPRSGTAFRLGSGQRLTVIDPEGEQVSDLVSFNAADVREHLSSGRSIDYAGRLFLTAGDMLYSNRSTPMLRIIADEVGRHDFTLSPCSAEMFRKLYDDEQPPPGCQGNLEASLAPYGIAPDDIPVAFNVFMHVDIDGASGRIAVRPPLSKAGQSIAFEAMMDLVVGMTACSAGQSNNFRFKPIDYEISDGDSD
ncbi:MAG: urea carboxylase-associated family protein [Rhodospirillales bacterium]|nr:urea carboxylase-associated family protein [Rhodospirillales bacterium]